MNYNSISLYPSNSPDLILVNRHGNIKNCNLLHCNIKVCPQLLKLLPVLWLTLCKRQQDPECQKCCRPCPYNLVKFIKV